MNKDNIGTTREQSGDLREKIWQVKYHDVCLELSKVKDELEESCFDLIKLKKENETLKRENEAMRGVEEAVIRYFKVGGLSRLHEALKAVRESRGE